MMSKEELYITIGVKSIVPLDIVALMIEMAMEVEEKDYLQVFRIEPMADYSILRLTQEIPNYEKSIRIEWIVEQKLKLFYMNNVLMLAEEY